MTIEDIKQKLAVEMPEKTYKHVLRVEATGIALAEQHGLETATVRLGCLLHDAYKHWPLKKLQEAMGEELAQVTELEREASNLLHGRVAARLCPGDYGVGDSSALFSMAWHTTGHPLFNLEQLAVFVADKAEPKRDYPGVDEIRLMAARDLRKAAGLINRRTLAHLQEKGAPVHPMALEALKAWEASE